MREAPSQGLAVGGRRRRGERGSGQAWPAGRGRQWRRRCGRAACRSGVEGARQAAGQALGRRWRCGCRQWTAARRCTGMTTVGADDASILGARLDYVATLHRDGWRCCTRTNGVVQAMREERAKWSFHMASNNSKIKWSVNLRMEVETMAK